MNNIQQTPNTESRVQRAFNNAAFFWLDRTEFPLADFLQACTTNFLLRPDFTSDDAAFILKWLEKQKRDAKSNLNKTLKHHEKLGLHTKDLDVVKISLKAFMTKPTVSFKTSAKANPTQKITPAKPKAKIAKKVIKSAPKKPIKAKAIAKVKVKAKIKPKAKIAKKMVPKKAVRTTKKPAKKVTLLKKVKTSIKNSLLRSKNKQKKRRIA